MTKAEDMAKRAIDVAGAIAGLGLLWPVLAGLAVAIKLDSPGPVFYRGRRAGRGGQEFRILKFRTMVPDAESRGGPTTGTADRRVTRLGRILRRHKLDELPQLFNVLAGEMSLVGPRPEVFEYVDRYTPEEREILSVRPGITDLSSIEFANLDDIVGSEDPDRVFRERILPRKNALRLEYVRERSLWLDARILARTVVALVPGSRRGG